MTTVLNLTMIPKLIVHSYIYWATTSVRVFYDACVGRKGAWKTSPRALLTVAIRTVHINRNDRSLDMGHGAAWRRAIGSRVSEQSGL